MGLTRDEMEVHVGWDADTKLAQIIDYRQKTFDTLTAAGFTNYREHQIDNEVCGWTFYDIPMALIRIGANGVIKIKAPRKRGQQTPATPTVTNFFKQQRKIRTQPILEP